MIDVALARRVCGCESPIGKRFRSRGAASQPQTQPWAEIVGVVGLVLNDSLESDLRPQVYWPETQRLQDRAALVVRVGSSSGGGPESYVKSVIGQIQAENPDQPEFDVRSMDQWIDRSMQGLTLTTSLISIFGGASLLLA